MITDIKNPQNGPMFSIWHIDGHGYQWQVNQIASGLPLEPSVRMKAPYYAMQERSSVDANASYFAEFDGMSISLRMNNITNELDDTFPRITPITADTYLSGFLSYYKLSDGTYDDAPIPSPFAPSTAWADAGKKWSTSLWMKALQEKIPNPTSIILRENNEGPRLLYSQLFTTARVLWYRADNNTMQFATINTPRDKWLFDGSTPTNQKPIVGDHWQILSGNTGDTLIVYSWYSDSQLDTIDQRAKDWVGPRRGTSPYLSTNISDFDSLYKLQYKALYDAFRDNFVPSWKNVPFRTVGYGQDNYHDAWSLSTYTGWYRPNSLTDASYRNEIASRRSSWISNKNPATWQELSIRLRGPTIFAAIQNNTGDFVDAQSYAGFNTHYCWAMQMPGKEVRLVWWEGYLTKPEYRITGDNSGWSATVNSLGRPDLNSMTVGQCEIAIMEKMKQIHEHSILRKYWKEGTTEILNSYLNTASLTRVYATATTIPNNDRKLLAVYTPCRESDFNGSLLAVGEWAVPYARFAYYLTNPLEPLPKSDCDCSDIEAELQSIKVQLQTKISELNSITQQLNDKTIECDQFKSELNSVKLDLASVIEQLQNKTIELESKVGELISVQSELELVKQQLQTKTDECVQIQSQLELKTIEQIETQSKLDSTKLDLESTIKQLEDKDIELNSIKAQLFDLEQICNDALSRIASAKLALG